MRIVTLGPNPYLLTATGRIHSWIIQHFHSQCEELAVIAHNYDTSYFVPEIIEGRSLYCYSFEDKKVPVFPYNREGKITQNESNLGHTGSIPVYEILNKLQPDLLITVDSYENILFMQAIRTFLPDRFKWLCVLVNDASPVHELSQPVLNEADAVLCTNQFTFNDVKQFYSKIIDWNYVGTDLSNFRFLNDKKNGFSIFSSAKNLFKDGIPTLMEACQKCQKSIHDLKFHLHANVDDSGFYDLNVLRNRFDPEEKFIEFPDRYVSFNDGLPNEEFNTLLNSAHVFLSCSVMSSSSVGLFEALASGCIPLLSDQGCDKEIIELLNRELEEKIDFLIETVPFMTIGEKYIQMPVLSSMTRKMLEIHELVNDKKRHKELIEKILKFIKGFDKGIFLNKAGDLVKKILKSNTKIFSLEN